MEENLHILKEIGAQKIHKDTHISREFVQAIIHETFDGLNTVQLTGFISILEREYDVDLSGLKKKAKEHFHDENEKSFNTKKVFVSPERQQNYSGVYIALVVIVFAIVAYFSFTNLNTSQTQALEIDNTKIEDVEKSIITTVETKETVAMVEVEEVNTSAALIDTSVAQVRAEAIIDVNETSTKVIKTVVSESTKEEIVVDIKSLKILPKNKVWAGYINIKTHQKYQKIFRKEFVINPKNDWLLLFGSGTIYLEVNGEKKKYASSQNMRFKYVDGVFKKITITEFKKLNKGRKW